jgi:uncharacterized OsmC-like protein
MGQQQGSKQKKPGRDKIRCSHYKARFTREKNKIKKINRHLKRYGDNDKVAVERVKFLKIQLGI